ncbi:MAG TPA: hypothetical protein VEF04_10535, partial [Blastocatellia bacterium]|nr:hypothetical protein [Blastocatellia bacterium]
VIEEKLELQFLLPDKFLKIKTMSPPGGLGETSITEGFDGKQEWTDVNSSGPDAIFFRGDAPGELKAQMLSQRRAEFARYLLAFLLTAPNSSSVEWGYFGKAESNDGRADVLDAKADGIAVRFFFDEQTHLPLMFSYKTKILPMMAVAAPFPAPEKKTKKLEKAPLPAPDQQPVGQAKEVEIQVRLDDYREVGGLKFPHHLVFVMDEQINEEWEKLNWKVNPKLSADKFQPRKK